MMPGQFCQLGEHNYARRPHPRLKLLRTASAFREGSEHFYDEIFRRLEWNFTALVIWGPSGSTLIYRTSQGIIGLNRS